MAVNGFNRSVLALLWQSRLRENDKITQNRERSAQRRLSRYLHRIRLVSVCEVIVRIFLPKYIYVPQNRHEVQD